MTEYVRQFTTGFEILSPEGDSTDPTPGDPGAITTTIVPLYRKLGDNSRSGKKALTGADIQQGTGETMDALRKQIGDQFPPKLLTAADSYDTAADAFTAYAGELAAAQKSIDEQMRAAQAAAPAANQTLQKPAAGASAAVTSDFAKKQTAQSDAQGALSGAQKAAGTAKGNLDTAANKLVNALDGSQAVPERSFFQKIGDFLQHNPFFQILLDVVIGIVAVFFPVVGFLLGAASFAFFFAVKSINSGHVDAGALFVGLVSLIPGAGAVLGKLGGVIAKTLGSSGKLSGFLTEKSSLLAESPEKLVDFVGGKTKSIGKAISGAVSSNSKITTAAQSIGKAGQSTLQKNLTTFAKGAATEAGKSITVNGVGVGITAGQNTISGDPQVGGKDVAQLFAAGIVGGVVGSGLKSSTGNLFQPKAATGGGGAGSPTTPGTSGAPSTTGAPSSTTNTPSSTAGSAATGTRAPAATPSGGTTPPGGGTNGQSAGSGATPAGASSSPSPAGAQTATGQPAGTANPAPAATPAPSTSAAPSAGHTGGASSAPAAGAQSGGQPGGAAAQPAAASSTSPGHALPPAGAHPAAATPASPPSGHISTPEPVKTPAQQGLERGISSVGALAEGATKVGVAASPEFPHEPGAVGDQANDEGTGGAASIGGTVAENPDNLPPTITLPFKGGKTP